MRGPRLRECARALLELEGRSADAVSGCPDTRKLRSSMTRFAAVAPSDDVVRRVLDAYFDGGPDPLTLAFPGPAG